MLRNELTRLQSISVFFAKLTSFAKRLRSPQILRIPKSLTTTDFRLSKPQLYNNPKLAAWLASVRLDYLQNDNAGGTHGDSSFHQCALSGASKISPIA